MTVTTKERPILFSGPMIRAILDGRKTQTRRVVEGRPPYVPQEYKPIQQADGEILFAIDESDFKFGIWKKCPYGVPGNRLWVRETWETYADWKIGTKEQRNVEYRATCKNNLGRKWSPSIHMPRWASRILLEVTAVRVERLQEISKKDAKAEGVDLSGELFPNSNPADKSLSRFPKLWDSLNAKRGYGWDTNCWVWVVEFKRSVK